MEPNALLNASYLDIVFDRRNKAYGAYELRKNYDRRIRRSALFLFLGLAVPVCFAFTNRRVNAAALSRVDTAIINIADVRPPKPPIERIEPPPTPSAAHHMSTHTFTPPVITPNDLVRPDELPQTPTANATSGLTNTTGDSLGYSAPPSTSTSTMAVATTPPVADAPFTWVEQMPEFLGNKDEYMKNHTHYPEAAIATGIQGRVVISFVVNEDGSVGDAKVVRGIGGGCDEEALRMVAGMPKWKPARHNGVPVKVFFVLPVKFELE